MVGRSNVGKSSFLCSLVGRKGLAKISATPGKTRLINYFLVDGWWYLVDLPGYGYAKVSKAEHERWGHTMQDYLEKRQGLVAVVQLVDSRHGPRDSDLQMHDWLQGQRFAPLVILTKRDKLSRSQALRSQGQTASALGLPLRDVLLYSSIDGDGRDRVLDRLGAILRPGP